MKTKHIYTSWFNAKVAAAKEFEQIIGCRGGLPKVEIAKVNIVRGTCQTFAQVMFKTVNTAKNGTIEAYTKKLLPKTCGQLIKYVCPRYANIAMCEQCEPKSATLAEIAAYNNIAE